MTTPIDPSRRDDDGAASVLVFCGSSAGTSPAFRDAATALGAELARRNRRLVFGGGRVGLMGAVADAVLAGGGEVTGVITEQLVGLEKAHTGLTELEVVADMHARKARMAALADGVVVLPGGFGTLEEMFEILTWNQLGIVAKPVVLFDVEDFYAPLASMIDSAVSAGFMKPEHGAMVRRTDDASLAVDAATAPAADFVVKWVD